MTLFFFTVSLVAGAALLALSVATLKQPTIAFWPPPGIDT
jgi:hypothetical protein